jgi:hypothetical protein
MSSRLGKTKKNLNRHGVEILTFKANLRANVSRSAKNPSGRIVKATGPNWRSIKENVSFTVTEFPLPPLIPSSLQDLLNNFRALTIPPKAYPPRRKRIERLIRDNIPQSSKEIEEEQKKPRTRLNGFIAFRAFYSQDICDPTNQRELSKALSKVWSESEELQQVWTRYAAEYNSQYPDNSTTPFVTWLLHMTDGKTGERNEWSRNISNNFMLDALCYVVPAEIPVNRIVDVIEPNQSNQLMALTTNFYNISGRADNNIDPLLSALDNYGICKS